MRAHQQMCMKKAAIRPLLTIRCYYRYGSAFHRSHAYRGSDSALQSYYIPPNAKSWVGEGRRTVGRPLVIIWFAGITRRGCNASRRSPAWNASGSSSYCSSFCYLQITCWFSLSYGLLRAFVCDQKRSERIRLLPYSCIALTRSCFMEFFFMAIPPLKF